MTKICIKCKKKKSLSEFHKNKNRPHGRQDVCKQCKKKYDAKWRKNNYGKNCKSRRTSHLKQMYGLSDSDYNAMFEEQDGKCKICGIHQRSLKRTLNVDHNHKTGFVRGLLCAECNKGLGNFKDNVELLQIAASYLENEYWETENE